VDCPVISSLRELVTIIDGTHLSLASPAIGEDHGGRKS
jgi:hypothetical protein